MLSCTPLPRSPQQGRTPPSAPSWRRCSPCSGARDMWSATWIRATCPVLLPLPCTRLHLCLLSKLIPHCNRCLFILSCSTSSLFRPFLSGTICSAPSPPPLPHSSPPPLLHSYPIRYPTTVATLSRRARDVVEDSFERTSDQGRNHPSIISRLQDFGFR